MAPSQLWTEQPPDPRAKWPFIALAIGVVPLFMLLTYDILEDLFPWMRLPSDLKRSLEPVFIPVILTSALYIAIYPILALGYAIKRWMSDGLCRAVPALLAIPLWGICVLLLMWQWQTGETISFYRYEVDECANRVLQCWLHGL